MTILFPTSILQLAKSVEAKVFKDPAINTTKDEITKDKNHENTFKFFDAPPGVVSEALACFKSISHVLNLPVKFDVINSLLEEQSSKENGKISLDFCAAIFESLGLQTQLLQIPVDLIGRVETPCLIEINNSELCVGLASKPGALLLSRPSVGLQTINDNELSQLIKKAATLPVLVLRKTSRTHKKNLTLLGSFHQ